MFIILKLLEKIAWSWWWVLSPLWIPGAVVLAVLTVIIGVAAIRGIGYGIVNLIIWARNR